MMAPLNPSSSNCLLDSLADSICAGMCPRCVKPQVPSCSPYKAHDTSQPRGCGANELYHERVDCDLAFRLPPEHNIFDHGGGETHLHRSARYTLRGGKASRRPHYFIAHTHTRPAKPTPPRAVGLLMRTTTPGGACTSDSAHRILASFASAHQRHPPLSHLKRGS